MNKVIFRLIVTLITILVIVTFIIDARYTIGYAAEELFKHKLLDYNTSYSYTYSYYPKNVTDKDYIEKIESLEYNGKIYYPKAVPFYNEMYHFADDDIYFLNRYHHNKEVIYCSNAIGKQMLDDIKNGKEALVKVNDKYIYRIVLMEEGYQNNLYGLEQFIVNEYTGISLEFCDFENLPMQEYEESVLEITTYYDFNGEDYYNFYGLLVE